jgi:hypothetical protein
LQAPEPVEEKMYVTNIFTILQQIKSIALLATEDVDDVERAIEISSLSPLVPTDGAN